MNSNRKKTPSLTSSCERNQSIRNYYIDGDLAENPIILIQILCDVNIHNSSLILFETI